MKKVVVSISCCTYNQEKYIAQAIEGFLMQKTNFPYEIVIHDDCSTDNTRKIIEEYQKKYPEIIKPIFEDENQYSKNSQSITDIALKDCKGEYIACCEGDDYWIDENKLQKQYDYMKEHPKCSLIAHSYYQLYNDGHQEVVLSYEKERDLDIKEFLLTLDMSIQTGTVFFKRKDYYPAPELHKMSHVGDIPLQLTLISKGYLHYMTDIMSVYRFQSIGSFSSKNKNNRKRQIENHIKTQEIFNNFNKLTKQKYKKEIEVALLNFDFNFYLGIEDISELKKEKYKVLYTNISMKRKLKLKLKNNKLLRKIYNSLKKVKQNGK